MPEASTIHDPGRLAALHEADLLDTEPEAAFDRFTRLASTLLHAPVSLVSLVDAKRQFFKSCVGLPESVTSRREIPLSHSFCKYVVAFGEPFVVTDATRDPRVCENPAVADLGVRAYLGMPIATSAGLVLGSFCVVDVRPRVWTAAELSVMGDLRDSVAAEIELRMEVRQRQRMEAVLRNRETKLREQERRLTEEIRNKDLFLAFLGHELRGPVSAMVNATYLLRIAGTDDQAVVRSCDVLDRQLGQILSLVDDIQDVTRVQQGKIRLEIERTNVMSALDQGIEAARSLIDGRNHHLSVDAPSEPIYVNADASRLAQVFSNLLTNAARYTPPGGRITTGVERQDGMAAVAVRDTGFGIPAEMHERVFELFFRLDHETSQGEAGMGIGLSLVKGLVEMQGGQIELSSDGPGLGSEFVVRLPLADV